MGSGGDATDPAAALTLGVAYRALRQRFREAGLATPDLDARLLLGEASGIEARQLPLHEDALLTPDMLDVLARFESRRLAGEPVGRILGRREFWGLEFHLNADTLEPRPDTETLVEAVLRHATPGEPLLLADIGTGSGAIAVALLHELPGAVCMAVDISEGALSRAVANAALNRVGDRFLAVRADYLSACAGGLDWVISNPPYIATDVVAGLADEVRLNDPNRALDGGADGLDAYRVLVDEAQRVLALGGRLAFEIGYDQGEAVSGLMRDAGFDAIEILQDLAGQDRVVLGQWPYAVRF
ncbi:peptide chain release factor N(5)-glutamine methyltransferase [Roseibium aestuarii]|uniref:Release factor glutamine methyltransferase n=1 Tax=Roseibium aestuarii TaxID=2600299 RepID=A0ABW4JVM5_9HYPH|nr:peptide chain release factor N(5)-glutamine methyltransferase [Roseibium aestuarii]